MNDNLFNSFNFETVDICFISAYCYVPRLAENFVNCRTKSSFVYVVQGKYIYSCDGEDIILEEGSTLYLPPYGKDYSYRKASKEAFIKQVDFDFFGKTTGEKLAPCDIPVIVCKNASFELSAVFDELITLSDKTDLSGRLMQNALMYSVFSKLTAEDKADRVCLARIAPALEYMENNCNRGVSAGELARLCKLSESQLRRLFKASLGTTPIAYLNTLRINRAKNMLRYSGLTVSEIAYSLGFEDIYAFSHAFKKATGLSPKKYAATNF